MSIRTGPGSAGEAGTRAAAGPAMGISILGDFARWVTSRSACEDVSSIGGWPVHTWSGIARAHEGRPDICGGPTLEKKSTVSPRAAPPTLSSTFRFAAASRSATVAFGRPLSSCARNCCEPCILCTFPAEAFEGVPSLGWEGEDAEDCARSCARFVGSTGKLPTELDGDECADDATRHLAGVAADFGRIKS